jgi:hypothetical protein
MLWEGKVCVVNGRVSVVTLKVELVSHYRTLELSLMFLIPYRYLSDMRNRPRIFEVSERHKSTTNLPVCVRPGRDTTQITSGHRLESSYLAESRVKLGESLFT